jgi:hypothetical protein
MSVVDRRIYALKISLLSTLFSSVSDMSNISRLISVYRLFTAKFDIVYPGLSPQFSESFDPGAISMMLIGQLRNHS